MTLRVTVIDLESGESETRDVAAGDYLLTTADPCYVAHIQTFPRSGTHILTVKGWGPQKSNKEGKTTPAQEAAP
jgi:hypothetical protein